MKSSSLKFLALIAVSFLMIYCSDDNENNNQDEGVEVSLEAETRFDVSYGNNSQQVYDIYLPEGRSDQKTKVIVLVHGGGWVEGDKVDVNGFINLVQETHPDHAIVNMNYRLAVLPNIPAFPRQFLDVQAVIQKLTAEKDELQIVAEFGMIGVSAGAHLSLMYDYVYDTTDQVKFVCDIVGPTDFTDPFYANDPNFEIALNFFVDEDAYPEGTDYAFAVSPALQVNTTSSPTILFYGNQDPLVPLTNGERLKDALVDAAVENDFTIYDGGHGDWDAASFIDLQIKVSDFIDAHLPIED